MKRTKVKMIQAVENKIPYVIVVGDKEIEAGAVSVRARHGKDLGTLSLERFIDVLAADVAEFGR